VKHKRHIVRCVFENKTPCFWLRAGNLCGYPSRSGPHLFDTVCHSYRPRENREEAEM